MSKSKIEFKLGDLLKINNNKVFEENTVGVFFKHGTNIVNQKTNMSILLLDKKFMFVETKTLTRISL